MAHDPASHRTGLLLGLSAYLIWGVMPLYFKALAHVPATEIVAHRILWSLVLLAALATLWRRWPAIAAAFGAGRIVTTLVVTSLLIAVNWLTYIYAVVSGHVLEASLGYYLNPLVNVMLGVVLLKEKLSRPRLAATLVSPVSQCAPSAVPRKEWEPRRHDGGAPRWCIRSQAGRG